VGAFNFSAGYTPLPRPCVSLVMVSHSPFYEVDADTDSGILAIVAITGSLLSLSTLVLRFFILRGLHTLRSYDYALLLAFALLLAQTALSMHATSLGIGKHRSSVSPDQIRAIEQVCKKQGILLKNNVSTHVFILFPAGSIRHLASCDTRHRGYSSLHMPVCPSNQCLFKYSHGKQSFSRSQHSEFCRRFFCNLIPLSTTLTMGSIVVRHMLRCDAHLLLHDWE